MRVEVRRFSLLVWRWKVVTLPEGGDARRRETDDQVETRDVHDDHVRIYGEPPAEEARAVSVAIDSNDTRSAAEAYGEILFRAR